MSEAPEVPPAWFQGALDHQPERDLIDVEGARIELLQWGACGKPGLLFLHGNGAHADWWSFIAPFFAQDYRCAALSWGGMGKSDWRAAYSRELFVKEALAAAEAAGLYEHALPPVVVGHSFGGLPSMQLAKQHSDRVRSLIIVDTPLYDEETRKLMPQVRLREHPIYSSREAALARFRLTPPEIHADPAIMRFIAEHSIAEDLEKNEWTWRFDPFLWSKTKFSPDIQLLASIPVPMAYIYGEQSQMITPSMLAMMRTACAHMQTIAVPEAAHHVMIDQPLAFVAAARAVLAGWGVS